MGMVPAWRDVPFLCWVGLPFFSTKKGNMSHLVQIQEAITNSGTLNHICPP